MARTWESIICFEDRSDHIHTSRWRLSGIATKEGAENTDSGVLWLKTTDSANTITCDLYKDDACASGNKVATGSADVTDCDDTGANAVEVTLAEANSSGLTGSLWIHYYEGDDTCPVQVALCTDEDMDSLFDRIDDLAGYDSTNGCAEFIRVAGDDVIGKIAVLYREHLDGYGSPEAWYITDADRHYPDLRKIANPSQLRLACAHRALAIALGRSHQRAQDTMYSTLRDYHNAEYEAAMNALVLTTKTGSGDDAEDSNTATVIRQNRA